MYIYPPGEEEPSPMYEGLRTNLPHVRLNYQLDFPRENEIYERGGMADSRN
jgi:hypothetical protein